MKIRRIPGVPGYAVSASGILFSCRGGRWKDKKPWTRMKLSLCSSGYPSASVMMPSGKCELMRVHRLVAWAWLGPQLPGFQVNHIDGDKTNNDVTNLEYVTHSQNAQHAHDHGLYKKLCGERNGNSRFTEVDIRTIKELARAGVSQRQIAKRFDTKQPYISCIVNCRYWKHVK